MRSDYLEGAQKEPEEAHGVFRGRAVIDLHTVDWNMRYDRQQPHLPHADVAVCWLVVKGQLHTRYDGTTRMMISSREQCMKSCPTRSSFKSITVRNIRNSMPFHTSIG